MPAKSPETREALLAASMTLFARNGFAGTSVDDIASACGITKGAVYWHFKGKEELFDAILERIRARWQEVVLRPVTDGSAPRARLDFLFDCYTELFTEAPERCLFLQRILLEDDAVFAPRVAKIFRQTARFIAKIIEEGKARGDFREDVNPLAAAHAILGALSGASQQSLANRSIKLPTLLYEVKAAFLARLRASYASHARN
jgi:TetR/AcrR family transcriptional regulator, acrAB operon repressor